MLLTLRPFAPASGVEQFRKYTTRRPDALSKCSFPCEDLYDLCGDYTHHREVYTCDRPRVL